MTVPKNKMIAEMVDILPRTEFIRITALIHSKKVPQSITDNGFNSFENRELLLAIIFVKMEACCRRLVRRRL